MERLTQWTPDGASLVLDNPGNDQEARRQLTERWKLAVNRLAVLEDAEEQGRLVVLPIKPGTRVWTIENKLGERNPGFVGSRVVNSYGISTDGYMNLQLMDARAFFEEPSPTGYADDIFWEPGKIGKTIFLTSEEAQAALEAQGGAAP